MRQSPTGIERINTGYRQRNGASVLASYGIVIEYFSGGDYPLAIFFKNYKNYFDLDQPAGMRTEEVITGHFHDHSYRNEKPKIEFVHEFHLSNLFNTRVYCGVVLWRSELLPISTEEVSELRYRLIDGGLVMVIYHPTHTGYHCVVLGFDQRDRRFFTRDPAKNRIIFEDFLSHHSVTEYILFDQRSG